MVDRVPKASPSQFYELLNGTPEAMNFAVEVRGFVRWLMPRRHAGDGSGYRSCGLLQDVDGRLFRGTRERAADCLAVCGLALGMVTEAVRGAAVAAKIIRPEYRLLLFGRGEESGLDEEGGPRRRGFKPEEVDAVLTGKSRIDHWQRLRCRVRDFADGLTQGTKSSSPTARISNRSAPPEPAPFAAWKPTGFARCATCACEPWVAPLLHRWERCL